MAITFEQAAERARNLKTRPSDEDMLSLYALYKQATVGDAHGEMKSSFPGEERAKRNAWEKLKGMSQDDAKAKYITLAKKFIE